MPLYFKKLLFCAAFIFVSLSNGLAAPIKITLLANNISLTYPSEVRFSSVLNDAYSHTDYTVYSLGSAFIDPKKQAIIDQQKTTILDKLKTINTPDSSRIAKQLTRLNFMYREKIEADIHKVRSLPQFDPMIKGDYFLLLPKRPRNILFISSNYEESLLILIKTDFSLKNYIAEFKDKRSSIYDDMWIIQANQDVYLAEDYQWKNRLYFLSPGAIVFSGLNNLPDKYHDLNADIAHLLTFHVEL